MGESAALIGMTGIVKTFGPVTALDNVDLSLMPGEVHALVGQNGSGKSTLCRLLAGLHRPDAGRIVCAGQPVRIEDPIQARRLGIALIPQEPNLVGELSVAENICLGREPTYRLTGILRRRELLDAAADVLANLGCHCDPGVAAKTLSIPSQELVAIARALVRDARVLLFDEPTSSLSRREIGRLEETVRALRSAGAGVVFVSHRLDEVFRLADRLTILRDGRAEATLTASETNVEEVLSLMLGPQAGRKLGTESVSRTPGPDDGEPVIEARDLVAPGALAGVSIQVRAGELLGVTGQVGAGKTELARRLAGVDAVGPGEGELRVLGLPMRFRHPSHAIRQGVGYLPEDRAQGLVPLLSVSENMLLADMGTVTRAGVIRPRRLRRIAEALVARLGIILESPAQAVATLSGGNQQKVGLARWLQRDSRVLVLDEPTKGVDVAARVNIHALIRELADSGRAVVMLSSDPAELVGLCDRIVVLRAGKVAGIIDARDADEAALLAMAV